MSDILRPRPKPPTPPRPIEPLSMVVVVYAQDTSGPISGALISGEMGRPTWTVVGIPLSFYQLRFTAPPGVSYGQPVSLHITATGYADLQVEIPFAPDANVLMQRPEPVRPPARTGLVSLVGRAWMDDGGLYYPLGDTLLYALGHWHRGQRDLVHENLDYIASHGHDYVRILGQVNWSGQEIDPTWPDYEAELGQLIDAIYDHGLRTKLTLVGGGAGDVRAAAAKVSRVVSLRREKIQILEAVNEQNGSAGDAILIAQAWRGLGVPVSIGRGNTGVSDIRADGDLAGASVDILHTERGLGSSEEAGGIHARQVRQAIDFRSFTRACENGEPPGPASSVATLDDPEQMAAFRIASILWGAGAFCLHTGHGVYGRNYASSAGYRFARLADSHRSAELMQAVRTADAHLPLGIENWTPSNKDQPIQTREGECNKHYWAHRGKDFVSLPLGCVPPGEVHLTAQQAASVSVYRVDTGETLAQRDMGVGDSLTLRGRWAYLIVGVLQ